MVAKNGNIADVIPILQKKANLDDETADNIRIFEVHSSKVYKELKETYSVAGINDYVTLYAEKIPEEELEVTEEDSAIYAFHFNKEPTKAHGVPFRFVLKPVCVLVYERVDRSHLLTYGRARRSKIPKYGWRSGRASRARRLRR